MGGELAGSFGAAAGGDEASGKLPAPPLLLLPPLPLLLPLLLPLASSPRSVGADLPKCLLMNLTVSSFVTFSRLCDSAFSCRTLSASYPAAVPFLPAT